MLTHGSLFSGIGGFDLGFERAGITTLWQVEIDPYCQAVIAKHFPDAKRYADVQSVHGILAHASLERRQQDCKGTLSNEAPHEGWPSKSNHQLASSGKGNSQGRCPACLPAVDVITGGFPCQPFSVAGKRRGISDDRWLWPQMRRVIEEVRPRWVVAENVLGLITLALDTVLSNLEALGYATGAVTVPA